LDYNEANKFLSKTRLHDRAACTSNLLDFHVATLAVRPLEWALNFLSVAQTGSLSSLSWVTVILKYLIIFSFQKLCCPVATKLELLILTYISVFGKQPFKDFRN